MFESAKLLDDWRSWDGAFAERPTFVKALRGGLTNRSYLIRAHERTWVLRQSSSISDALGIDRYREQKILQAAEGSGLAPPIAFCAPDRGILISEFIGDVHLLPRAECEERIIELTKAVHQLVVDLPITDHYAHAENYWQRLCERGSEVPRDVAEQRKRITQQRNELSEVSLSQCLCHRDLIPENVIQGNEQLYVIDWEYAAVGDPTFDYASLIVDWNVAPSTITEKFEIGLNVVEHAVDLYRYTCDLWHRLNT